MTYEQACEMLDHMRAVNKRDAGAINPRTGEQIGVSYPGARLRKIEPGNWAVRYDHGEYIWYLTAAEMDNSDLIEG